MSDYIDRQEAIQEVQAWSTVITNPKYLLREDAVCVLETLPAVETFQAVRCKDCAYWRADGDLWPTDGYCKKFGISNKGPDFFCADGKREEDMKNRNEVGEWIFLGHQIGPGKHPWSVDYKCPFCGYEQYTLMSNLPDRCPSCLAHLSKRPGDGEEQDLCGVATICEVKP